MKEAKSGVYKELGNQLRLYPGGQIRKLQDVYNAIASMKYSVLEVGLYS